MKLAQKEVFTMIRGLRQQMSKHLIHAWPLGLLVAVLSLGEGRLSATSMPIEWSTTEGGNGHYYELVSPVGGIAWTDAKTAAEGCSHLGRAGHLATVTSQAEWDFIVARFPQAQTWIGLTDNEAHGGQEFGDTHGLPPPPPGSAPVAGQRGAGYVWVTGEPMTFSAWGDWEPNNSSGAGGEDWIFYEKHGSAWDWIDFRNETNVYGTPTHYLVEYPVPEPSTLVLALAGCLLLGTRAIMAFRRAAKR